MRKLKLPMNITIDGFVSDSDGKLDWMLLEVDEKQINYLRSLTSTVDTILLGRKMAGESIPHWKKIAISGRSDPETEYAKFFTATRKIVFSKTPHDFEENTSVENGDLEESIKELKNQSGKEIIVYGGAAFVASLIGQNLIDELNLFVHPVSLGRGLPIFNENSKFKLIESQPYSNGVVLNKYQPSVNNKH
jgi:dihydrofolate reductase